MQLHTHIFALAKRIRWIKKKGEKKYAHTKYIETLEWSWLILWPKIAWQRSNINNILVGVKHDRTHKIALLIATTPNESVIPVVKFNRQSRVSFHTWHAFACTSTEMETRERDESGRAHTIYGRVNKIRHSYVAGQFKMIFNIAPQLILYGQGNIELSCCWHKILFLPIECAEYVCNAKRVSACSEHEWRGHFFVSCCSIFFLFFSIGIWIPRERANK